jgi:hypothetical protein
MQIEIQPMASLLTPKSVGICAVVLMLAIVLYVLLKRDDKQIQAMLAPLVLLCAFFAGLHYELHKVYSMQDKGADLIIETPLGSRATACHEIEFMINRGKGGCIATAYRGDERLFETVEVVRSRCDALVDQLRQLPCKPSDSTGVGLSANQ